MIWAKSKVYPSYSGSSDMLPSKFLFVDSGEGQVKFRFEDL